MNRTGCFVLLQLLALGACTPNLRASGIPPCSTESSLASVYSTPPENQAERSAKKVVEDFFHSYLKDLNSPFLGRPTLPWSAAFRAAITRNQEICEKYADGICGFGTDGDIYLDSQEYEAAIDFCSTGARVLEEEPGLVEVHLNVYPSLADSYYDRHIKFRMIKEEGHWAVDDIIYSGGSARQRIEEENAFLLLQVEDS